ncbi:MAG: NAD(+) synthase [Flavobacteriales bacterium]|nr:NAD(+) synthase [Flavobacteriales bacterium]
MKDKAVIDYITNWLQSYAESARCKGFVIGVSGGIDSALTSTLCARTGLELLCVEMPIHQEAGQDARASRHIDWLCERFPNVYRQRVELSATYDAFRNAIPDASGDRHDLSLVNTRARLRMSTLYYFAGLNSYLVAGTGNKVEDFGVGFYTKYGDGGVDLSPIADLMKSDVYRLAAELGVITEILEAVPTDGLWGDDRTDEDQLGASYDELEWAMEFAGDESSLSTRQMEVLSIYRRLNRINQHKMVPIPVCTLPDDLR